jgi:hypothetical protein
VGWGGWAAGSSLEHAVSDMVAASAAMDQARTLLQPIPVVTLPWKPLHIRFLRRIPPTPT